MLLHAGSSRSVQPDDWMLSEQSSEAEQEDNARSIRSMTPGSRRSSLLSPPHGITKHTESRAQSSVAIRGFSPDARTDDNIAESEVGELLCEAARLLMTIQSGSLLTYLEEQGCACKHGRSRIDA